ncbi:MAG TPA: tetratricopeptide repeat protein, partial [Methylomirabilota bacterium]|nr:tetratricopeptide repeat protein [Methylomirabilota bacterium]
NLQAGAVQVAIDDLERFIRIQPKAVPAYVVLGAAYLAARRPGEAVEVGRKLATAAPRDARGPYLMGLGLGAQGKRAEARQQLEASLTLAPQALEPLAQLVSLTLAERQPAQAVERVKKQIPLAPNSAPHQLLLGETYAAAGDAKAAEAAFQQAIALDPNLMGPYVRLAGLYAAAGRFDEALAKVNDAAKRNPNSVGPLILAGIIHEQKGDIPKARESYEKALAINPRLVPAANNLAWIYSEHDGDKDKALQLAQTAKELAPDDPRVSDTLGWILYKRGVYQSALALLRESAAKLGDNPQVQYHLGMVYAQLGDQANARKALNAAIGSPANFPGKDEARKTLADLK